MTRLQLCCSLAAVLCACGLDPPAAATDTAATDTVAQASKNQQGMNMQGMNMQGMNMQGMNMQGMRLDGATMSGDALHNVRVENGEVVAEHNGVTLHGTQLVGAHLHADVRNLDTTPPTSAIVEYQITAVEPEDAKYDPTKTGKTFLYTLEQWVPDTAAWQPACPVDTDGRQVAIPLAATWDEHGDRIPPGPRFTFGCTTGVIAKCYRWGYRPWVTGYGDLVAMHWTCTRLARADYCGNGTPHTHDGTWVNVWDTLPKPGPIQKHGLLPPLGMLFEAGWNTGGAVCLSHARWLLDDGPKIAAVCPDRLLALGLIPLICDTVAEVLGYDVQAKMFDETKLNPLPL